VRKHVQSETIKDYKQLLTELINLGYTINSITIDGKRGLYKAFEDYPVQNVSLSSEEDNTEVHNKAS